MIDDGYGEEHAILTDAYRVKLREAEMIQTRIREIVREANGIPAGEGGGGTTSGWRQPPDKNYMKDFLEYANEQPEDTDEEGTRQ